jgi:GNAT superfamily N-acetyltransferase
MKVETLEPSLLISLLDLPINDGYEDNLKYFHPQFANEQTSIVAYDDATKQVFAIRGFGQAKLTDHIKHYMNFYVTVHPNFRGQGLARALSIYLLNYLNNLGEPILLTNSSYTEDGEVLIPMWENLITNYPNVSLLHKKPGHLKLQDARYPLLGITDKVETEYEGKVVVGEVLDANTDERYNPMVLISVKDQENLIRVARSKVKKI